MAQKKQIDALEGLTKEYDRKYMFQSQELRN
jgi:hypothetical protein